MTPSHKLDKQPDTVKAVFGKTKLGWVASILIGKHHATEVYGSLPRRRAMRRFSAFRKSLGLNG